MLPDFFWLWLASKLKPLPHPFNQAPEGAMNLNYSSWEYDYFSQQKDWPDLPKLVENKKVCDLACGGGGKAVFLAEIGAQKVKGCDLNENFIRQAQSFAKKKKLEAKCHFIVGNAEKNPYQRGEFDIVLLASILEHTQNSEQLLREAVRICKPQGLILINTEGYWHWLGHHLWDTLPIPWLHLFTTEKQRIRLYKKAVQKFPDEQARIDFRIIKNKSGQEKIGYLNQITLKQMEQILSRLQKEDLIQIHKWEVKNFQKPLFKLFGKTPLLREMFHERVIGTLESRK